LNEAEVGRGWKKSGVPREEIFVGSNHSSPNCV
jgi:diketogulonate reductase-like aldo/keto reductase